jgi:hypothetical protein
MAVTLNLQNTITWAQTLIKQQPLNVSNMEPGLTCANMVLQRVLGSPFVWRFNRGNASFAASNGAGTDYAVTINDLGRIETQWLTDNTGTIQPLEGAVCLPKSATVDRPRQLAPQYDDNAGNITFRLDVVPDTDLGPYTVFVDYQRKAKLMTSFGSDFGPVPDEFGYVFNMLFLAFAGQLSGDARAFAWSSQGAAALIGAQKGLKAQEIAIFLGEWERAMQTMASAQGMEKLGQQALAK